MRTQNFAFATELANTMDWNMAPEDFQFSIQLEPEGCFVLFDDSKAVGIATCVSYGKVGWFGNLIVKEEYRGKGAGSQLVTHAVDYLRGKGVETIGLYAYPYLTNFYGKLGFKVDLDFAVLHAQTVPSSTTEKLPKIAKRNIRAIAEFDEECFGGNRLRLLESIILEKGNLGYYVTNSQGIKGYVAATVYETLAWVGPLICRQGNSDAVVSLVLAALAKSAGKSVYTVLPKQQSPLKEEFSRFGFKEEFFVSRMFLGKAIAKNCIYLAESLERG